MDDRFDVYLRKLRETPLDEHTEHTGRSALETLLNRFASDAERTGISVQHEPKREADKGAPDFKIRSAGRILGYVEVKEVGAPLAKVLKSDQIKRYRSLSDNIILTDYLDFIWIGPQGDPKTGVRDRATLAHQTDLEARTLRTKPENTAAVTRLLQAFFSEPPQGIGRAQILALALASRSQLLRDFLTVELTRQAKEKTEGRLHALYDVFRRQVFHELTVKEFADAFAQMLAYGLFLARLNAGANDTVTLTNVRDHIPGSFRLIRELVRFLEELREEDYAGARWVVDEVLSIVNGLDIASIQQDLSFRQRKAISRKVRAGDEEEHRLFERDPFIYFYEDYLKAYDPAMRKGRGVYYTPPPIVNFIVRAVDDVLKESFGIPDGLADRKRVTVLDFACGTGTFLLEVFERVFDNIGGPDSGRADPIVREHLTQNVFGFEYLIAPYTIAHLKLSQYLKDKGHPLKRSERLKVFLTNTLEPIEPQPNLFLPELAAETKAAQEVKEKPILVIVGNPPYSRFSRNRGEWIRGEIEHYKYVDGRHFGERKHWLSDDYVKFLRFAQQKIDQVDQGIVAVITNHAFLDNPTFRGMRQSLLKTFDRAYIVNLHGNSRRRESSPDGSRDENIFDIEQGTAISIFVKSGTTGREWRYGDLWGKQLEKYKALANSTLRISDVDICPSSPMYFFSPHVPSSFSRWDEIKSIEEIFDYNSVGILTARDTLTVHFSKLEAIRSAERFRSLSSQQARLDFDLGEDSRDWTIARAQQDLLGIELSSSLRRFAYRPFDTRSLVYTGQSRGFIGQPSKPLARAVDIVDNLVLATSNRVEIGAFQHVLVLTDLPDGHVVSGKETNHCYPLKRIKNGNVTSNVKAEFRDWLINRLGMEIDDSEIFAYVYAVLFSTAYRSEYADFLLIDTPRIPFPENAPAFERLSALGWALVQAHLLRDLPRRGLAKYHGRGDHVVEAVRYAPADGLLHINAAQSFAPVPPAVWDFHVGGYQVLSKYLKSRKGRTLSLDEIDHVAAVADSLAFTIDQMTRIDAAYRDAFPERG